jgi:hypothetical protein
MKTVYKHIEFVPYGSDPSDYACRSLKGGFLLGYTHFLPDWEQVCFFPEEGTVHSATCLADIVSFLRQVNKGEE